MEPLQIPMHKTIRASKGTCDYCHAEDVEGYVGSSEIDVPKTEFKPVIEDYDYKDVVIGFMKTKPMKVINDFEHAECIVGYKKETFYPLVCPNCIKAMYKSIK